MDIAAVFEMIMKGITIAQAIVQAGEEAAPAFNVLKDLVTGAQKGTVTQDQLNATEAQLDAMIADFNLELAAT